MDILGAPERKQRIELELEQYIDRRANPRGRCGERRIRFSSSIT
jgi:hypothetical protein